VGATGLAANPAEYRTRLGEQPDEQIDIWVAEAMRDISIRRGVRAVLHDYQAATGLDERSLERVFAAGGGPPAAIGRDAQGQLFLPAVTLFALVPGTRAAVPGARDKLIDFLVLVFEELVYI
jgi:hypothetical protein